MQEQYEVEILPTAWEDLKKIEDYYLLRFGVESAMKVTEQILDSIERLESFPDSGSLTPDRWLNKQGIEDYYLLRFGVESAMKVTEQILDSIERLESFPDSGSLTPDRWLNKQGYRMVISERYVSIYRQIGKTVYVYHIADTQTEYTKLFS